MTLLYNAQSDGEHHSNSNSVVQSQKAVSAYFTSGHIPPIGFQNGAIMGFRRWCPSDLGLLTSIILFMKDMSTILNLSRLYNFVIKLRLLLASERLPRKYSKAHNLTDVLSLLRLFTKKFKKRRCNIIVRDRYIVTNEVKQIIMSSIWKTQ